MSKRLTVTLDDDVFEFVEYESGNNRSAFVNAALRNFQRYKLEQEILRGMQEDDQDVEYPAEAHLWETALSDGIEDEDDEPTDPAI